MTRPATAASSAAPLHDRSWTPSISEASASATTYRIARERVRPSSSTSKTTSDLNAMMAATLLRAQEHATEEERRRDEETRHKSPSPPIEPVSHMEADGSATPRRPSGIGAGGRTATQNPRPPLKGRPGAQTARRPPLSSPRVPNAPASPIKPDSNAFDALASPLLNLDDSGNLTSSNETTAASNPPPPSGPVIVKVNNKLVPILPMEQLVPSDKFRHHPEAWNQREDITKLLQKDPRLGYGRRVVPVALVQHRIESLMDVYRRNTDGALEKLQNRLKDAKQDRAVHRGPNALQTATIDAMDRASEEYLSTHRNAKEVPYAVLKQARDIVQSTTGDAHVKGRTSPEGWKHRNEQRLQQQRARLLVVEEQRKEDLQKTARRHEELVEAAAEQRRIEAAEQLCAVWETRAMLFLSHKVFAKALLQFRTHQHLVSSYSCLREHWTLWHEPAEDRATVLRRLRLKGKLRFALCAARLLGFHLVRKKHIKSITTMLSLRLSSQRFIYAVRHYICSVRLAQRRIRRYLAWKRARIVVLLLQWDAVERDMRNPNFSPLLGRSVVMDSSEHSGKGAVPELPPSGQPTAHTKDVKATGGKKSAKGSKDAVKEVVKSEDAMVNELVSRDKYDAPIPFDVRVAVVKRLWAEHRKRFYSVEQAILQRVDQEEYYKAMKAYQQLTQRKQAAVLSPKAPRPRVLPILLRRQTLIHAIQPFLDITRALLVKAKTVAARSAVRDNLHFEYFNRREAFTSLLHVNDDRMVAAFELKTHTRMPRLHLRDEAMVAMDDRNDAAGAIVSSPRTFSSSMTGGDASLRSKSFSHGSPVASTTPKGGDLVEIVSTKAVEVLQRRFPSEKAFAILGKHIEAMCRPMEQAVRDMEAPAPPPQAAAGKGTNTAGKQSPRGTARSQMPPTSAVNATHK